MEILFSNLNPAEAADLLIRLLQEPAISNAYKYKVSLPQLSIAATEHQLLLSNDERIRKMIEGPANDDSYLGPSNNWSVS